MRPVIFGEENWCGKKACKKKAWEFMVEKMDSSAAYSGFPFTGTWITAAVVGNEMHQLLEAVLSIT